MERKTNGYWVGGQLAGYAMETVGMVVTAFEAAKIYSAGRLDDPDFIIITCFGLGLYASGRCFSDDLNRQRIREELKLEEKVSQESSVKISPSISDGSRRI
ncbi:MAG: hypothetical protein AABX17_01220 [Nanoarchaeota archaeon]